MRRGIPNLTGKKKGRPLCASYPGIIPGLSPGLSSLHSTYMLGHDTSSGKRDGVPRVCR